MKSRSNSCSDSDQSVMSFYQYFAMLILFGVMFVACDQTSNSNKLIAEKIVNKDSIKIKTEVLQIAIDFDKLQWFYIDTISLVLMSDENTGRIGDLQKFNKPVNLKSSQEIIENKIIHYMQVIQLVINNDSAYIRLKYPSQGANAKLKLKKVSRTWEIYSDEIYEE